MPASWHPTRRRTDNSSRTSGKPPLVLFGSDILRANRCSPIESVTGFRSLKEFPRRVASGGEEYNLNVGPPMAVNQQTVTACGTEGRGLAPARVLMKRKVRFFLHQASLN